MYQWIIHRSWIKLGKYICVIFHCSQRPGDSPSPYTFSGAERIRSTHSMWTCDSVARLVCCIARHIYYVCLCHSSIGSNELGVWYTAGLTANLRFHGCWMGKVSRMHYIVVSLCVCSEPKLRCILTWTCIGFSVAKHKYNYVSSAADQIPCRMFLVAF